MSNCKEEFETLYKQFIKREGADKLWKYIEDSDFFIAPASTVFHGNYSGGLCEHSLNVYKRLKTFQKNETDETIAICGLLHDICKTNFYIRSTKNVQNSDGKWVKQEIWKTDDKVFYGHGECSVYILNGYIRLTREEALAIRWHMSGFDDACKGGCRAISGAYSNYPICAKLASADMLATYVDETTN